MAARYGRLHPDTRLQQALGERARLIDLSSLAPTQRIGSEGGNAMAQCKARTARGTQCSRPAAAPSRSLCGTHQRALARGTRVTNAATGRAFPKPR